MDHLVTENQCLDSDSEMGFHGSESNCTGSCEKPQNTDGFCFTIRKSGDLSNGFVVKKWKSTERQEIEEFEIRVPSGSVLLFPSERSVGIEAIDFEVKNLIVLDGTWAKAKRVYSENPWLKLLPHVKLDLGKMSLYGEVRNQPRAGYLSTIESIVHALKAVGDETDGLENLLEVFESMVGDQRRCKDERLSKIVLGKMSLYGEVRNQPRTRCLSTSESIVYALKAVGDETDELENLLEVFESMVEDQRRMQG
ncbi:DTW domain-containing protein [Actinidia rufa]|uniref:tRNA-uridine aminocarboxypropyltransferase n=1 Tax=Actinidia rufa TaxID=165716 RepID=A0A7J0G2C6_9ERIC|nr:DTW domain-containing protein [Actinidia rufa]